MKIFSFKQTQFIPATVDTVWDFFATPDNLNHLTPPEVNFEKLLMTGGNNMYPGQLIAYKLSPFPFLRVRWTTEITQVVPKKYFIDDQRFGPFALWHHQHFFTEKNGGCEMIDEVSYAVPFGVLGRLVNALMVENQVKKIFQYRAGVVEKIFKTGRVNLEWNSNTK
jgi:ligand-binding SRPBCC domain-containing protein